MPTLHWIGKEAVVNHHQQVPFRLLHCREDLSVGDPGSGNLLVEGDNLLALKALLPYYAGKVKCIYIDPPYNTGNEKWVYNDNVNSPEMRHWLSATVDRDDLSRHDKWACMMYPRLALLRQFLTSDGAIFISIDDNELPHLRCIMDEVFGQNNFIATIIWEKMFSPKNSARHLSDSHDYVLLYANNADLWLPHLLPRTDIQDSRYKNPDNDPRGPWTSGDVSARNYYSQGTYAITCPSGRVIPSPPKGRYWGVSRDTFEQLDRDGRIWWGVSGGNMPRLKRFLSEVKDGVVPQTLWPHTEVGNTQEAKKEVIAIVPDVENVFITPKPTRLLKRIMQLASDGDSLVMDSFAGSGSTGDAVLQSNFEDNKKRRFILIEMDQHICRDITATRLARRVNGYDDGVGIVEGIGGGFRYCTLGQPLFDEHGQIAGNVRFADLARHVFFTETGEPMPDGGELDTPFIGSCNGVGYYLLFNGILGDKSVDGGNVLTQKLVRTLPQHDGPRVIFGEGCVLSAAAMKRAGVTFRQIPYEVKVS